MCVDVLWIWCREYVWARVFGHSDINPTVGLDLQISRNSERLLLECHSGNRAQELQPDGTPGPSGIQSAGNDDRHLRPGLLCTLSVFVESLLAFTGWVS